MALVVALSGCGGKGPIAPDRQPGFDVAGGKITLHGKSLAMPCRLKQLADVVGEPTRRHEFTGPDQAAVIVHVWDDVGLFCFQRADNGRITKLSLALGPRDPTLGRSDYDQFWPKSTYSRSVIVDGAPIRRQSTPEQINDQINGHSGEPPFKQLVKFPFSWNRHSERLLVTLITDGAGKSIVECLVGE
jgi:hypothetical protein